ncbi:unnamed protein product, partial [Ectocarpus sp. 12 AP-2014]
LYRDDPDSFFRLYAKCDMSMCCILYIWHGSGRPSPVGNVAYACLLRRLSSFRCARFQHASTETSARGKNRSKFMDAPTMPNSSTSAQHWAPWPAIHSRACVRTNFRYPNAILMFGWFSKPRACQRSSVANKDINGHSNYTDKHLLATQATLDTIHPPCSARIISAEDMQTGCGRDARRELFNAPPRWFLFFVDSRASEFSTHPP